MTGSTGTGASAHLRIAVSGASGLIGSALVEALRAEGYQVMRLVRRAPGSPDDLRWDPDEGEIERTRLEGLDAIVNLAGEPVAERWNAEHKRAIRDSRVNGTALLANAIATLAHPPRVLVNASAVGFYGDRGDEILDEQSGPGTGFLPEVAQQWEAATEPARGRGVRVALARFGVVISPRGGALAKLLVPFKLGAGGKIGRGQQWMSTIALDDTVGALRHLIATDAISGPVNVTGPTPVTNAEFAHALGHALHRPTIATVPEIALRLMFGQMADETLLVSQRVLPRVLEGGGYTFRHRTIEEQIRFELARG